MSRTRRADGTRVALLRLMLDFGSRASRRWCWIGSRHGNDSVTHTVRSCGVRAWSAGQAGGSSSTVGGEGECRDILVSIDAHGSECGSDAVDL